MIAEKNQNGDKGYWIFTKIQFFQKLLSGSFGMGPLCSLVGGQTVLFCVLWLSVHLFQKHPPTNISLKHHISLKFRNTKLKNQLTIFSASRRFWATIFYCTPPIRTNPKTDPKNWLTDPFLRLQAIKRQHSVTPKIRVPEKKFVWKKICYTSARGFSTRPVHHQNCLNTPYT